MLRGEVDADAIATLAGQRAQVAVALMASGWPGIREAALTGLEEARAQVDEVWLRAAVRILADAQPDEIGAVLQVVFRATSSRGHR